MKNRQKNTRTCLEALYSHYTLEDKRETDPVHFLYRYNRREDREIIAFLAALFSYGAVKSIAKNMEVLLQPLGTSPAGTIENCSPEGFVRHSYPRWKYRFQKQEDLTFLFTALKEMLHRYGTLEEAFLSHYKEGCFLKAEQGFIDEMRSFLPEQSRGALFLFPKPGKGTAKRLQMFLRWMIRHDAIDAGLWRSLSPRELYYPVDTHIQQIAAALHIVTQKSVNWKSVEAVTAYFRSVSPDDPVKYDFALTRLAMFRFCPLEAGTCSYCPLHTYCEAHSVSPHFSRKTCV